MSVVEKIYPTIYVVLAFFLISLGSYMDLTSLDSITLSNTMGILVSYIAGIFGAICVLLVAQEKISNYLFGIISVTAWMIFIFVWTDLLWNIVVNGVYLILNIYGFYYWLNPAERQKSNEAKKKTIAKTRELDLIEVILYSVIFVFSFIALIYIGKKIGRYENNYNAFLDGITTTFAIFAQYFMARKFLANWYLWIFFNMFSIVLYLNIGSITLVATTILFLINSLYGLYSWKKNMLV